MSTLVKIFDPYLDPLGRVSEKPNTIYKGITDNPHLFTGEAILLLSLLGEKHYADLLKINMNLEACRIVPGLYSRHPQSFASKYNLPGNTISHDEYNGICFLACAHPEIFRHYATHIINYGQKNGWQYHDSAPNVSFFSYFKSHPIQCIKELYSYYLDMKNNPTKTNYIETLHNPAVVSLSKWRQPRDRAFYKIAAGIKPNIIENLWLSISIMITACGPINAQNRGGSILMAYFRKLAIEKVGGGPKIVQLAYRYFDYKLKKRLGIYYPVLIGRKYFSLTANHPMVFLLKTYLSKTNKDGNIY